jgi:LacI family transcriptional regulator
MKYSGVPVPTIKDIARESGFSVGTVSHVLSGRVWVEPPTAEKVREIARKLGYRKNESARLLVAQKGNTLARTGNVGVVFVGINPSWLGNPLIASYLEGLESVCARRSFHPLVEFLPDPARPPRCVEEGKVDGLIVRFSRSLDSWNGFLAARMPLVAIGGSPQGVPCPVYAQDDFSAGWAVASALWGAGHRNIAYLATDGGHPAFISRRQGFETFLREKNVFRAELVDAGLPASPRPDPEEKSPELGEALGRLLSAGANAVVAANDWTAVGLYRAAREKGLSLPRDLSIIAFDNTPGLCTALDPALTSFEIPFVRIAQAAMGRLLDLIENPGVPAGSESNLLGGRLVVRESAPGVAEDLAHHASS